MTGDTRPGTWDIYIFPYFIFFFAVGTVATIHTHQKIQRLPYEGFLWRFSDVIIDRVSYKKISISPYCTDGKFIIARFPALFSGGLETDDFFIDMLR